MECNEDKSIDPDMVTHNDAPDEDAGGLDDDSDNGLFPGDYGSLPYEARRVLVLLMLGPSIDARRHSALWPALLRYEQDVRRFVSELFLELILDADAGIAFLRQAETGDLDAPILLRRVSLTFVDSLLVLYLRSELTQAESRGERAVVEENDIVERLRLYERASSTDRAGFTKRVQASIQKMKDNNILRKVGTDNQRFEVSESLRLLFGAEQITALKTAYERMLLNDNPSESETFEESARLEDTPDSDAEGDLGTDE